MLVIVKGTAKLAGQRPHLGEHRSLRSRRQDGLLDPDSARHACGSDSVGKG